MIFTAFNEATAMIILVASFWNLVGWLPVVKHMNSRLVRFLAYGAALFSAFVVLRVLFWDVFYDATRGLELWLSGNSQAAAMTQVVNGFLNCAALAANIYMLRALHLTLPEDAQIQFKWWSSPLYRFRLARRLRDIQRK